MAHAGKLVIEQDIFAQTTDRYSHAVFDHAIQLGLGAVVFAVVMQKLLGSAGQVQLLGGPLNSARALSICSCVGFLSKLTNTAAV